MQSTENFPEWEWNCKCGKCEMKVPHGMDEGVMLNAEKIRAFLNRPVTLSSAYRCAAHPVEARKTKPGFHHKGVAFDVKVRGGHEAAALIKFALLELGVVGFSYNAKLGFVHLDWRMGELMTWNY